MFWGTPTAPRRGQYAARKRFFVRRLQYGTNTASPRCAAAASRAISPSDLQELSMKTVHVLVAALGLSLALGVGAQTKWDLPAAYPATNFHTENIAQFVADVDKATGGKLKITVHANASLFKANEIKRAVQGNQAQAGEILLVNFENEDPFFGLDGVPFLATGYGDAMKLYKAQRKTLEDKLAKQGIKLLYTVAWPPQGIYANRPLNSAADMKGLKWRAYSPATSRIAELVGAQPVTVQASELTQALATGVVDSYMSSGATGFDTKTYESIKSFYDTQAWLPKNAVIVNQQAFDALDKPTQEALLKAAADAEVRGWKMSEEKNGWYLDQLKQKGMTIVKPSPQLTSDLKKVGDSMLQDWQKKAGPDGQAVVDAYKKM
jgi:TRAP-type transport system periplasmic protein